jgi:hypothetical protein
MNQTAKAQSSQRKMKRTHKTRILKAIVIRSLLTVILSGAKNLNPKSLLSKIIKNNVTNLVKLRCFLGYLVGPHLFLAGLRKETNSNAFLSRGARRARGKAIPSRQTSFSWLILSLRPLRLCGEKSLFGQQ